MIRTIPFFTGLLNVVKLGVPALLLLPKALIPFVLTWRLFEEGALLLSIETPFRVKLDLFISDLSLMVCTWELPYAVDFVSG